MRILHTSDWHLGQHFMGKTRQAEHAQLCTWLVELVRAEQVDAVLIAGDVFDTGSPPSYAREQYNQLVVALSQLQCQLLVLGGNHDSVATLNESQSLLACLGARVIAGVGEDLDEQLVLLNNADGSPGAIVCAIPFIRPRDVLKSEAGQSIGDKQQALQNAIFQHYQQLFAKALALRTELGGAVPVLATGHLTTVGASASESVREIYVGSLEAFPSNAFPAADYIALGHIHRPQKVAGLEHIRYSGSPIALSFDELNQQKQVLLVDVNAQGLQVVRPVAVPCFQPLASVRGTLASLPEALAKVAASGSSERPVWLEVTVDGDDYLTDLHSRIGELCEQLPVEVLRLRRARSHVQVGLFNSTEHSLDELSCDEVFAKRLETESLEPGLNQRLIELHQQVLEDLQGTDA